MPALNISPHSQNSHNPILRIMQILRMLALALLQALALVTVASAGGEPYGLTVHKGVLSFGQTTALCSSFQGATNISLDKRYPQV
jgi:hypothetical protein